MILEDVWLKLLVATTDLGNNIISFLLKMDLVDTNEVKRSLDPHNWNCYVMLLNELSDHLIYLAIFSIIEFERRLAEEHVALFVNFSI